MLLSMRREHPDLLRADLQQYYSLDIDQMGQAHTVEHYAVCAANLPLGSRTMTALEPGAAWGWAERLLSAIEYNTRVSVWQASRDGHEGRNRPRPPIDPAAKPKVPERPTEEHMREVAEALGIEIDL